MGVAIYKRLCELLKADGCHFVRQVKGSHEVWFSPRTRRNIIIPSGVVNTHTANGILKDVGLSKHF